MTPHELMLKTVNDLEKRKQERIKEGIRQANMHTFEHASRSMKRRNIGSKRVGQR